MAWLSGNVAALLLLDLCVASADVSESERRETRRETQKAWDLEQVALEEENEALESSTAAEHYERMAENNEVHAQAEEVIAQADEQVAEENEAKSIKEGIAGKTYEALVQEGEAEFMEGRVRAAAYKANVLQNISEAAEADARKVTLVAVGEEREAETAEKAAEQEKDVSVEVGLADPVLLKLLRHERQAKSEERQTWTNVHSTNLTEDIEDRVLQRERNAQEAMRQAVAAEVKAQFANREKDDFQTAAGKNNAAKRYQAASERQEFKAELLSRQAEKLDAQAGYANGKAGGVTTYYDLNGAADLFLPLFTLGLIGVGLAVVTLRVMRLTHTSAGTFALVPASEEELEAPAE